MGGRFTLGEWTVTPELNSLERNGQTVHLEPKIMQVLVTLAESPGQVVSKKQILDRVWSTTFVSEEVLTRSVSELRRVFEDNPKNPAYIQTISKGGYRLVAPIIAKTKPPRHGRKIAIAAAALVVLAAVATTIWYLRRDPGASIQCLAVMPFVNVTADPNAEYLSDGITESLIDSLSQVPDLTVRPRASVFHYKKRDVPPETLADELKVQAVVKGRVTRRGDALIVSTELIDSDNRLLWGQTYERKISDMLEIQQDIALEIAARLREQLSMEQKARVTKGSTADPEAYQLYLKGRHYWEQRTPAGLQKARDFLNQAIARDPNFVQAYVGIADYWAVAPDLMPVSLTEALPNEKAAAMKALELDPESPGAHLALANVYCDEWDWPNAEREYRRALELDPKLGNAHHWYALYLSWLGRHQEAISHIQQAVKLDPLNVKFKSNLGWIYQNAGQYDKALAEFNQDVALDPTFATGYGMLGEFYRAQGKYDLWLLNCKKQAALSENAYRVEFVEHLTKTYAERGYPAVMRSIIESEKQALTYQYVDPAEIAYDYAALGDKNETFRWLEKAYAERSRALQVIQIQPDMNSLRSDSRYLDLLRRMGMPKSPTAR